MDNNCNIKIPTFEGYDKGPRWTAGNGQAVAFEDGATFAYVNYNLAFGWYARTICTGDDGEDEVTYHFATAEEAVAHVNQVYLDLQARISEYLNELELEPDFDIDEELLKAMEDMIADENLEFLGLFDEDEI